MTAARGAGSGLEDSSCCSRNVAHDFSPSHMGVATNHSWAKCIFMTTGLSMCITVDILQYSMPLAFLPSVLEDRGHAPMTIAAAIGVYYWTGFGAGAIITGYQVLRLVRSMGGDVEEVTTVGAVRMQLGYLIAGLGVGAATLTGQAIYPTCWVHTACRFLQGGAGAVVFFYAFLLCVALFTGQQQVFAVTMASTALNVAEVLGSSLGAWIFDTWGERVVFMCLGLVSLINQTFLLFIVASIRGDGSMNAWYSEGDFQLTHRGWRRLKEVLRSERLAVSVILIVMAAMVKSAVEEVLPFHADHRWLLGPMEIGPSHSLRDQGPEVPPHGRHLSMNRGLACYGAALGLTHTPAALLLADAVDHEEGRAKDAVNGIWNTMWEAGGSLGFLLGGLLAEKYAKQLRLFGALVICCFACSAGMLAIGGADDSGIRRPTRNPTKQSAYGALS